MYGTNIGYPGTRGPNTRVSVNRPGSIPGPMIPGTRVSVRRGATLLCSLQLAAQSADDRQEYVFVSARGASLLLLLLCVAILLLLQLQCCCLLLLFVIVCVPDDAICYCGLLPLSNKVIWTAVPLGSTLSHVQPQITCNPTLVIHTMHPRNYGRARSQGGRQLAAASGYMVGRSWFRITPTIVCFGHAVQKGRFVYFSSSLDRHCPTNTIDVNIEMETAHCNCSSLRTRSHKCR